MAWAGGLVAAVECEDDDEVVMDRDELIKEEEAPP
jgi:hypothetical protein